MVVSAELRRGELRLFEILLQIWIRLNFVLPRRLNQSGFFGRISPGTKYKRTSYVARGDPGGLTYFVATLIWLAYAMYGSPGTSAIEQPNPESPTEREIREWIDRNFRDPQMSAARTRSLV